LHIFYISFGLFPRTYDLIHIGQKLSIFAIILVLLYKSIKEAFMSYLKKVEESAKTRNNFFVRESQAGDVDIRYMDRQSGVFFTTSVLPAGVKASIIDEDFEKTRYRVLLQGEEGDKLLNKVKELAPDPEDVEKLLDTIEKVCLEYVKNKD